MHELTDQERGVLDLESRIWTRAGPKERAIREELGLSPNRYYQLLNGLLDDARSLAYKPTLVNLLRRRRAAQQTARRSRRAS